MTDMKVLGESPAQATAQLYQIMAQAAGLEALNAVANQQQMNSLNIATTSRAINSILGCGAVNTGKNDSQNQGDGNQGGNQENPEKPTPLPPPDGPYDRKPVVGAGPAVVGEGYPADAGKPPYG